MRKIQQLILNLSKRDLKKLISENYEILEHNYNNLMSRRPEKELLDTMRSLS
jgi:Txe/YoeB family toxin of Txe-Axe toxin-antitoxin module